MSWDTDSDIDLYTWDSHGNVLYYGNREGIPTAQLVEDVIPSSEEDVHAAELFQETAEFNRPYTFGICAYRGGSGQISNWTADGPNWTKHGDCGGTGELPCFACGGRGVVRI